MKLFRKKPTKKVIRNQSKRSAYNDVKRRIDTLLTLKQKEQLLCDLIKDVQKSKASDEKRSDSVLTLSQTRGKPLRIVVNSEAQKVGKQISADDVANIQTNFSLSSNVILGWFITSHISSQAHGHVNIYRRFYSSRYCTVFAR